MQGQICRGAEEVQSRCSGAEVVLRLRFRRGAGAEVQKRCRC